MVEVHCERCGTGYSLEETRLKEGGARVRCARCGHVFLVPKSAEGPPGPLPSLPPAAESIRREWRVRRRDGSLASLRELTTLQRWIVEGKLGREDEVGLDGENWRQLGTIPDLGAFFAAADAQVRVAALEEEVARLKSPAAPAPPAVTDLSGAVSEVLATPEVTEPARPRPPTLASLAPAPVSPPVLRAPLPVAPGPASPSPKEPAFTRTAAGLGVAPGDDWQPPKLHRGVGTRVAVLVAILSVAGAVVAAYFYVWKPQLLRAREEQARNSQLEREQSEHEASVRAAEQRAPAELLQSLAATAGRDGGASALPDAGRTPRGSLELPSPSPPALTPPVDVPVSAPTLVAAPAPAGGATVQAAEPAGAAESLPGGPQAAPPLPRATPQTYEEWMAEADRRRTHERAASALAAYDRALALKPSHSSAHAGRALALLDLGRRTEALAEFKGPWNSTLGMG